MEKGTCSTHGEIKKCIRKFEGKETDCKWDDIKMDSSQNWILVVWETFQCRALGRSKTARRI
jgi:hypothetical protein